MSICAIDGLYYTSLSADPAHGAAIEPQLSRRLVCCKSFSRFDMSRTHHSFRLILAK